MPCACVTRLAMPRRARLERRDGLGERDLRQGADARDGRELEQHLVDRAGEALEVLLVELLRLGDEVPETRRVRRVVGSVPALLREPRHLREAERGERTIDVAEGVAVAECVALRGRVHVLDVHDPRARVLRCEALDLLAQGLGVRAPPREDDALVATCGEDAVHDAEDGGFQNAACAVVEIASFVLAVSEALRRSTPCTSIDWNHSAGGTTRFFAMSARSSAVEVALGTPCSRIAAAFTMQRMLVTFPNFASLQSVKELSNIAMPVADSTRG
jgi:hypothetical protein